MQHPRLPAAALAAVLLAACPSGKGGSETGTPTGSATGSATGAATGTATGSATGSTTSDTGTTTGATTGTPTTGTPGPTRVLYVGCDPAVCTLTPAGGPWGGDLCSCTFDGPNHPTTNTNNASCFGGGIGGRDLTFHFDLAAMGYAAYSANACVGLTTDSSLASFDGDPLLAGTEVECVEDASYGANYCALLPDPYAPGPPLPTPAPATSQAWIVMDEWNAGQVWNGVTTRRVDFEFFATVAVCGDGAREAPEECDDGNTADGDGCDASCQREPDCGDGFVDAPEECDDANATAGDGCDACLREAMEIRDCDPAYCVLTAGAGPHGGDTCECTIPAAEHPRRDDSGPASCGGYGPEIVFSFDRASYPGVAATTCPAFADTVLALYDGHPWTGGVDVACNDDTTTAQCSKLWDGGGAGSPPELIAAPATSDGRVYVVAEEYWDYGTGYPGDFWDNTTDRVIRFELSPVTLCGNGALDALEVCDDGNIVSGDGCSADCLDEPFEIRDCDPAYCTWAPGAGPQGGDLCTCTIPGADHPTIAQWDTSCVSYSGADALFSFDRAGYAAISATTCPTGGDSVIGLYGDHPDVGPDATCNDDTGSSLCSAVGPAAGGFASYVNFPPNTSGDGRVYVLVDEYSPGDYWNGVAARTVTFELGAAGVCGNGTVEAGEGCDDANLADGDGCSSTCAPEPLEGCDARYCVLAAAAGPNGGDLCTCTIPAADHPVVDAVGLASCFIGYPGTPELLMHVDLAAGGYTAYAVDTCTVTYGDSAIATYDADPRSGGVEQACSDDANGPGFCSKITDTPFGTPAGPELAPATGQLWIQLDEYGAGYYWDHATDRVIHVELIP